MKAFHFLTFQSAIFYLFIKQELFQESINSNTGFSAVMCGSWDDFTVFSKTTYFYTKSLKAFFENFELIIFEKMDNNKQLMFRK
jgi:hypothetical protein